MSEQTGRRTAGKPEPWERSYVTGTAAEGWDIGMPQPAIVALVEAGAFESPLLDVGCGTGENALMLAAHGLEVTGVDWAPTAIERAQQKTADRELTATFAVADALALDGLERRFNSVIDSGMFHGLERDERVRYAASLHSVMQPGATLHLMCFSDREPDWGGPHRITQQQLRRAFAQGWRVESIEPSTFVTATTSGNVHAWLARIRRD
jgi:cyclopropane fatty-acyl-phospholipid synthase-like methyltransferase